MNSKIFTKRVNSLMFLLLFFLIGEVEAQKLKPQRTIIDAQVAGQRWTPEKAWAWNHSIG